MYIVARHWLLLPALLAADVAPESGSCGCDSQESASAVPGTATITGIDPAPPGDANCQVDPVLVAFEFVPDDPKATYARDEAHLRVGGGLNPTRHFVERKGIAVGATYPCTHFIGPGPDRYSFADLDLSDYELDCVETQ